MYASNNNVVTTTAISIMPIAAISSLGILVFLAISLLLTLTL